VSRSILRRAAGVAVSAAVLIVAAAGPAFAGPSVHAQLPPGVDAKLNTLLGGLMAVVIALCVAGVFTCAGKLALAMRHGEGAEAARGLGAIGGACILVACAAGIVDYLV
jgi:hypothetical protein